MGRPEDPILRWSFLICKASSGEDPTLEGTITVNTTPVHAEQTQRCTGLCGWETAKVEPSLATFQQSELVLPRFPAL